MTVRRRWFAIACVAGAAWLGLGAALPGDPTFAEDASRLADVTRATLGFEVFLGSVALAGALFTSDRALRRLGLARGRLSTSQTLALIIGTLGMSAALDALLDLSQLRDLSSLAEFERLVSGIRGRELLLASLAFAVAPGICEELLCRGLLQRGLVARLGAPAGIVLASMIFGVLHVDPIHALLAAGLGLYLGIVCQLADGIRATIACHITNNGVALASAAWFPEPLIESSWGLVLISGAVALGALAWVRARLEPGGAPPTRVDAPAGV